jgi:hypothetical protein
MSGLRANHAEPRIYARCTAQLDCSVHHRSLMLQGADRGGGRVSGSSRRYKLCIFGEKPMLPFANSVPHWFTFFSAFISAGTTTTVRRQIRCRTGIARSLPFPRIAKARCLEILRSDPKPDRGLRTLLSRLDELDDYGFFRVHEADTTLWDSENPTIIRIHTTQNDNLQRAFAALVFYSLYKDMFRRGVQDHITHAVIFDEAHRAAGLKLIPTMAKECRKYGISLVLASQEARDFNTSLFSAVANYLVLRLTEADAKALVRNVASSQQERLLVDRIKQMDRFRAFYFSEGKTRPSLIRLAP